MYSEVPKHEHSLRPTFLIIEKFATFPGEISNVNSKGVSALHAYRSLSCLQNHAKLKLFVYFQTTQTQLASRSASKIWLTTTHYTNPRHVNLRACTRLLPVVYLHVVRTSVARNAHWTCTAQSSCTYVMYSTCILCMAKVRDKRCSQSGVLGAGRRASAIARLLPDGLLR